MKKPNLKKVRSARRKRPKGGSATHEYKYIEVQRKSNAGVVYTKYKKYLSPKQ